MATSKRGGRRDGAGRPQGARSRATKVHKATLSDLAREYTSVALQALVSIAQKGESESARVAAANSLLDRAYGKATQSHEHSGPRGGAIQTQNIHVDAEKIRGMTDNELDALESAIGKLLSSVDDSADGEAEEEGAS